MADKVYEDGFCTAYLSDQPMAAGHLVVVPNDANFLESFSHNQVAYLYTIASYCATMLFEGLQAQGTNIIASNGPQSHLTDEFTDRVALHVIPRYAEDKVGLMWQIQPGNKDDISGNASKISGAFRFGDEPKPEKISVAAPVKKEEVKVNTSGKPERDYRIEDIKHRF